MSYKYLKKRFFKSEQAKMCQATSNRCEYSSVQTAEHILQERPLLRRHCSMSDISSEDLLENLLNIDS